MGVTYRSLVGGLIGLVLAAQLCVAPAVAAGRPHVSIATSSASVLVGADVVIRGNVTLDSKGVGVQLQRKQGNAWKVVLQTRVRSNKGYSFRVKPSAGVNLYRARTVPTRQLRSAVSRVLRVRGTVPNDEPPPSLNAVQQLIFDQVNQERTSRGLAPYVYSEGVEAVAQPWAEHMAATGQFEHNPNAYNQMPSGWTGAAENIAYSYAPEDVVAGWMNSPGHRENILGDYTHIGVGYAVAADGNPYYVQNFGKY